MGDSDEAFSPEDVDSIVKLAITQNLADVMYNQKKVNDQINKIVDKCLEELRKLERPFRYIVTCIIMQKNGAGMNTAATMFWDTSKDGKCVVQWSNDTMNVVVTVFGLAVNIDNSGELD
uniref:Dynein light chain n=1 Tax=Octactis speculum TaxID=3111310 RepID=A0A7S2DAW6_9STRA|mmetsp:Transcript_46285/g.62970  ORF Transcript_46285/g.62970 Transcript_46285/m.62970 type:complete len:119 (+) Transcript_46285:57-413(+)|eukprot:CAMPEP_0185766788 /NCGR_PEP_ID=MMETSP1174-20130828/38656_1 /TAXON_ID=35687 /ORGANISM="Dictyocha speculum, Strain CCMP1381" /LENGTH=118 /DNA_ID=CAMNT_0028450617 /DNA_START=49 /DNA_END=405 /DNA_ORIENTATION=-